MIGIEWICGRGDAEDERRAIDAAQAVFDAANVDPLTALIDYRRQWHTLDGEDAMIGAARILVNARDAANLAATEGWHDSNGGYVDIVI